MNKSQYEVDPPREDSTGREPMLAQYDGQAPAPRLSRPKLPEPPKAPRPERVRLRFSYGLCVPLFVLLALLCVAWMVLMNTVGGPFVFGIAVFASLVTAEVVVGLLLLGFFLADEINDARYTRALKRTGWTDYYERMAEYDKAWLAWDTQRKSRGGI